MTLSKLQIKIKNEDKLKFLNEIIVELEEIQKDVSTLNFISKSKEERLEYMETIRIKTEEINLVNESINNAMKESKDYSNRLFLGEIVEIEKPIWGTNNLIISPVGSGKTTLITESLLEDEDETYLLLVSTHSLKESLAPKDTKLREKYGNRMYTTSNKKIFGNKKYKILVMTYAEFGNKIYVNNDFIEKNKFKKIFCDEIHSLPFYIKIGSSNSSISLAHAQRLLFNKIKDCQVFYFTATKENILTEEKRRKGTLSNIQVFDYSNYPNIMQYTPQVYREINDIEQIRQYLKDRKKGFKAFGYKGMIYSKTIKSLKSIEKMLKEEGYNPLVLWSENNSEHDLSEEQKNARKKLFENNKIPEPYDFIVFNSALQEGWNLKDDSVKMAVINTVNDTEYIQALGRLRRDVDLLIRRTKEKVETKEETLKIPDEWLNKPLVAKDKLQLAQFVNSSYKWPTLKKHISDQYSIQEKTLLISGKKTRCTVISEKV